MNEIVWLAFVTVGSALVCCIIMLSASIEMKWREEKHEEKEGKEEETEVASAYWRTAVTATSSNGNYTNSSHTIQLVFYLKLRIQFNFFFFSFLSAISFRLFYIFKEKVQFKVMSPAKTRISNIEPSTIANRMHSINWNRISFLENLNIPRILKFPFVEMPQHTVFCIGSARCLKGSIFVLVLNGSRFPINLGPHTVESMTKTAISTRSTSFTL